MQALEFANRHFYIACLLEFLIFLPNLIWPYNHHFPVVFHMRIKTVTTTICKSHELLTGSDDPNEMEHAFIKNFESAVLHDSVTIHCAIENGDLIIISKGADTTLKKFFFEKLENIRLR